MRTFFAALRVTGIFLCITSAAQAQQAHHLGRPHQGIVVSGECLTKVAPDRASVTLGSSVIAATSRESSEKATKAHESIKKAVKELALPSFVAETAEYSVQEECSYSENKRRCHGYRTRIATRFETSDIARVGDIIAVGSGSSTEEVSELSIFPSPSSLKSARESCLEVAMKNASVKAQKLALGAGVTLGKLLSVVEAETDAPQPYPAPGRHRTFEAAAMSEAVPSIDAKPMDLRVEITAQYALD